MKICLTQKHASCLSSSSISDTLQTYLEQVFHKWLIRNTINSQVIEDIQQLLFYIREVITFKRKKGTNISKVSTLFFNSHFYHHLMVQCIGTCTHIVSFQGNLSLGFWECWNRRILKKYNTYNEYNIISTQS